MESAIVYRTALIGRKTTTSQSMVVQLCVLLFSVTVALAALSIGLFCVSRDLDKTLQLSELQNRIVQLEDELSGVRRATQLLCNELRSTAAVENDVVVDVYHLLRTDDGKMAPPSKNKESEEMHYGASNRMPVEGDDGETEQHRVKRSSNHRVNNNKNKNNNKNVELVTQDQQAPAPRQQPKNAAPPTPTKPKPKRPRNPATPAKSSSLDPVLHFESAALQNHKNAHGNETIIKGWQPATWMSNASSTAFHQHGHGASVNVTEPGLYLIYAQVSYWTNADQNGFSIIVKAGSHLNSHHQVLARCIVGVDYLTAGGDALRPRTCQTTTIVHLAVGQRVLLRDVSHADQVVYLNDIGHNYWGLVRLSATPS